MKNTNPIYLSELALIRKNRSYIKSLYSHLQKKIENLKREIDILTQNPATQKKAFEKTRQLDRMYKLLDRIQMSLHIKPKGLDTINAMFL